MSKKIFIKLCLVLLVLIGAFGVRQYLEAKETERIPEARKKVFAPMVANDNTILRYFKENNEDKKVILACEEDVTNDGLRDLLVIYSEEPHLRFVVVCGQEDGSYKITDPIPAPIENQTIQFINIDKENEMEFIISGEKNGATGYGIYRMIDGQPKDLFGDSMEACC